ncbi:MAG: hypothetical protein IKB56_03125 [Clostridia bacterium]|nr:hypothetical protein [Clostridia bacterium]
MAKKQKLTKEEKKMKHARAVSGNGSKANPYYPTDYSVGKRNPKKEEKPMIETARPMTTKQWVGTLIVLMIPLVNIIALIAWINKKNGKVNPSKRTFAKAYFIVWAISLAVAIVLVAVIVVSMIFLFPFPATPEEAVSMLEDAGYVVESTDEYVYGITEDGKNYVTIYYFESEELAEQYFEELEEVESEDYLIIGLEGNAVYLGTEEAVNAINGGTGLF